VSVFIPAPLIALATTSLVAATVWAALRHRPEASAGRQIDEFGQFV